MNPWACDCYKAKLRRIFSRLLISDGCWEWQGARGRMGHGQTSMNGRNEYVHRVMYWLMVGPIIDGMVIDHLCRNPRCARPSHLEQVTLVENTRRGISPSSLALLKDVCANGHPFDLIRTDSRGRTSRSCSTCRKEQGRRASLAYYHRVRIKDLRAFQRITLPEADS